MSVKSQERKRAMFAYEKVCNYKNWINQDMGKKSEDDKKKLRTCFISYAKDIPSYVKINGLIATLAFVQNKKAIKNDNDKKKMEPKVYKYIYNIIKEWLIEQELVTEMGSEDFIEQVFKMSSSSYKLITTEVLSLFGWIKRFAESELTID